MIEVSPTDSALQSLVPVLSDPFSKPGMPGRKHLAHLVRRRLSAIKRRIVYRPDKAEARPSAAPLPYHGYDKGAASPLVKRALMTYVATGFHLSAEQLERMNHSAYQQAVEIANAFNRLGYIVDVIDVFDRATVPSGRYDVFFGEHENFERLQPHLSSDTIKIFYGTRPYWQTEHNAIKERAERIQRERGAQLLSSQWERPNNWLQTADGALVIGNDFTLQTFKPHHPNLRKIDNTALPAPAPVFQDKSFDESRNNFLWLGSGTLLRKGLDLVLEAFAGLPECHLWVCGPLDQVEEEPFCRVYRKELFHTPNIHPVGFVAPQSQVMRTLMDRCGATIFTSCAEGMAGSILNTMAYGLLPIISQETGIDVEGFGFTLKQSTVNTIRCAVHELRSLSSDRYFDMAREAHRQAITRYTMSMFTTNIEDRLRSIIREAESK